jgi:hypothetical protein
MSEETNNGYKDIIMYMLKKYPISAITIIGLLVLNYLGFNAEDVRGMANNTKLIVAAIFLAVLILALAYTKILNLLNSINGIFSKDNDTNLLKLTIEAQTSILAKTANNLKEILSMIIDINNSIKGVPNKEILLELIKVRTKVLFVQIIECNTDTLFGKKMEQITADEYKRKSRAIKNIMTSLVDRYISDIIKYSKNTLNASLEEELNIFSIEITNQITQILVKGELSVEMQVVEILSLINDLSDRFEIMYKEDIKLTPPELDLSSDPVEKED